MAKTTEFEALILKSFYNKFTGGTVGEQIVNLIMDPMIRQIISKNRKEKFFIDKDKESIELLEIILAGEKAFVQQYNGPHDSGLRHDDKFFYSNEFLNGEFCGCNESLFYNNKCIDNTFYRDGLSEFLIKLLNNRNFFNQMKKNQKNIMLFLLLFEYESNSSNPRYCQVEYKQSIYSNFRRPFIIKFQFSECILSMEIEECPISNYITALYVKNMIRDENFINHLINDKARLNNFVEGISEIKNEEGDVVRKLLVDVMKELLKNQIFMNKVTENLDTLSKLLKSDVSTSLLGNRSFIGEVFRTNKNFIIRMAEIAGYDAEYLTLNIRTSEKKDTLLVRCVEAILRNALEKVRPEEEKIKTNIEYPILYQAKDKRMCRIL